MTSWINTISRQIIDCCLQMFVYGEPLTRLRAEKWDKIKMSTHLPPTNCQLTANKQPKQPTKINIE